MNCKCGKKAEFRVSLEWHEGKEEHEDTFEACSVCLCKKAEEIGRTNPDIKFYDDIHIEAL